MSDGVVEVGARADVDTSPAPSHAQTSDTGEGEGDSERTSGPFGGLSASDAAKKRHDARRERDRQRDMTDAAIVEALRTKASKGDVAAARELRAWLDREHEEEGDEAETLAPSERDAILATLRGQRGSGILPAPSPTHAPQD